MKKLKTIVLIVLILSLLMGIVACNDETFEGQVVEKEYLEANTRTALAPIIFSNGKTTTIHYVPVVQHYPERWRLTVERYTDGKYERKVIYVSKDVFNEVNVGDWFVYDKNTCSYNEPYEQERAK